jgi:hypothetical protein
MMNYLRESLHWMHLAFFKPMTLAAEAKKLSRRETVITFLKVYPAAAAIYLLLFIAAWGGVELLGYSFNWNETLIGLAVGLAIGLIGGLVFDFVIGLFGVFGGGMGGVLFGMLFGGLFGGLGGGIGGWLIGGVGGGLGGMLGGVLGVRWVKRLGGVLIGVLIGWMGGGLVVGARDKGLAEAINYALVFLPAFFLVYFRAFYLLPYILQYARAGRASNPFLLFRNSPVYWGEVIATPLPRLKDWLVDLTKRDRERGLEETLFVVEKHPFQRKAAFKALLAVAEQDLQQVHDMKGLANATNLLKAFPADDNALPRGLDDARRRLNTISTLAQDYRTRLTPDGQLKVLEDLRGELENLRSAMAFTAAPVGTAFHPLATRWLEMVEEAQIGARARLRFTLLPNPYVAGAPLLPRDFDLLKGRRDIIRALEKYILNANQRLSLLLYGRRRAGKSSTLLNLPRLLSSQFEPVYIDCQDAKWQESDQAFCYNLARDIFDRLHQSEAVKGISQPQEEQFEKNAFTRLDQYLNQFEQLVAQRGKRILLAFDEYEGLEESIVAGDISKNVPGKLRNIIQHRERIVVLVSGSHHFEELTRLNWASYLINTRTLELSFLDEKSARELLTEPVPQLRYEEGVLEEILRLTHCQPYLLQAVASELVNHLNDQQKTTATRADLDAAVEKVLTSAGAYFANTWREDNSAAEQTVLRAFATGEGDSVLTAEYQAALQSLCRKEMLERTEDGYRLAVPLFGRWIVRNQVIEALPEPLVRVA